MVKRHIVGSPRGNLSLYRIRGVPYRYSASKRRSDGDAGPGTVYPIFQLGESSNLALQRGLGSAFYTRASEAMCIDHEGIVRTVPINCALRKGARYVRNLLTKSENFADVIWGVDTGGTGIAATKTPDYGISPDGNQTACRAVLNKGAGVSINDFARTYYNLTTDLTEKCSCWLKSTDGGTYDVQFGNSITNTIITVTGEWQRFSGSADANLFLLRLRGGFETSDYADLLLWHPQMETVEGQSNQNPGEYVSVGVLSDPYHGLGADGIKAFDYENGNTVDGNGVVTEAPGAAISPAPVWEHQPGSKNKCGNYNIAPTNLFGVILNQSGTGATCTVEDNAEVLAAIPNGNGKVYDLDTTAATAGAWVTITGTVGNLNPHTLSVWAKLISGSAALKLEGAAQSTAITEQEWTRVLSPNVVPDTTGRRLIVNAIGTTTRVLFIANQLEEKPVATALIPVAIVAASRAQPEWKYDRAGNADETEGMLVLEGWSPGIDYDVQEASGTHNAMVGLWNSAASLMYQRSNGGQIASADGTLIATLATNPPNYQAGGIYNIAVRWGATLGTFQVGYQDVTGGGSWLWGSEIVFDGAYTLDNFIQLFYANAFPHTFKDIKIWPTDEGTEFIEGAYP